MEGFRLIVSGRGPVAALLLHLLTSAFFPGMASAADPSSEGITFFEADIRPILIEHCYECHSTEAGKRKGGLFLDSRWAWETGGDSGPAIEPGDPDNSLLIDAVRRTEEIIDPMPPKSRLSDREIAALEKWVAMGAPDPRPKVEAGAESAGDSFDIEKRFNEHWSWRPVQDPDLPAVKATDWPSNEIDHFILARLESAGLRPANEADRRTWLRRIYFDLIGLPPSREEIHTFLEDASPDATEKAVDRLLDSPHFGEKWTRHWMDLVRYAETYGHEFDYPIHHAWRYRDYLIRAFNSDLPYDQFIREHIAGDLVTPRPHPEKEYNESVIATGFWYFHDATHAPTDVLENESGHMENQIDVFGKAFQGLTISCARCHDHKFDAISTADYYALTGYLQASCRTEVPLDEGGQIKKANAELSGLQDESARLLRQPVNAYRPGNYAKAASDLIGYSRGLNRVSSSERDIVFEDFEKDYGNWKVTGNAFGKAPTSKAFKSQRLSGNIGKFANSYHGNDKLKGSLTSKPFTIEKPFINFLIAGGHHATTRIELIIDGESIRQKSGTNTDALVPGSWQVMDQIGRQAGIRIVDDHSGGWGHIDIDQIVFSDHPTAEDAIIMPPLESIRVTAQQRGLDPDLLVKWCALLGRAGKDTKQAENYLARYVIDAELKNRTGQAIERELEKQRSFETTSTLFADFSNGLPEGWSSTGYAFQPAHSDPVFSFKGDGSLLASLGTIDSGSFGKNQVGTLRSPTFAIPDSQIHVKARANGIMMRVVPSNYHMAIFSALLFRGTVINGAAADSEGEWKWFAFGGNLDKYVGQNAFLEFVDSGGGSIEIAEIRFSNEPAPPVEHDALVTQLALHPETETIQSGLNRVWSELIGRLRAGQTNEEDVATLNWFGQKGLIRAGDIAPDLASLHEKGTEIASSVAVPPFAVAMAQGSPENARVYIRGKHFNLGEEVPNRYLEVFGSREGDRLDLANQIASASNPLTSRVMVNRIWHHLFGRGIVASVDDFGPQGTLPSHPLLLDWLATDFVENGWSLKHIIRKIVLSRTYRQQSVAHPDLDRAKIAEVDQPNLLLHHMPVRRLQAEAIRDAILAVSGRLDRNLYGPGVPTHRTAFMTGRGARASGPLDGDGRRSIYGTVYRNFLSPFMLTFDQPSPFGPKGRRSVSNVPAQALVLMNDPFVIEQSEIWAKKSLAGEELSDRERISHMYESATGRIPGDSHIELLQSFLDQQSELHGARDERAWADLAHALFNLKDFIYLN